MRRLKDGLLIYSVGPERVDLGEFFEKEEWIRTPAEISFRLWDPDKRRQEPPKEPGGDQKGE